MKFECDHIPVSYDWSRRKSQLMALRPIDNWAHANNRFSFTNLINWPPSEHEQFSACAYSFAHSRRKKNTKMIYPIINIDPFRWMGINLHWYCEIGSRSVNPTKSYDICQRSLDNTSHIIACTCEKRHNSISVHGVNTIMRICDTPNNLNNIFCL